MMMSIMFFILLAAAASCKSDAGKRSDDLNRLDALETLSRLRLPPSKHKQHPSKLYRPKSTPKTTPLRNCRVMLPNKVHVQDRKSERDSI
jgi:hypothetical protein